MMNDYGYGNGYDGYGAVTTSQEAVLRKMITYRETVNTAMKIMQDHLSTTDTLAATMLSRAVEQHRDGAFLRGGEDGQNNAVATSLKKTRVSLNATLTALTDAKKDLDRRITDMEYSINRAE